ncbi:hypothetical protein BDN70DRAFT_296254 [Pholiota conissans]|uniref:Uncharacterized protein n=1 Tax=Pholiota conissans TaxID=109636 RepID=A0A9P5YUD9_9AGAR|nr:hypothetical protein BDN70DRAFT_296254 [Pholiota conissans]
MPSPLDGGSGTVDGAIHLPIPTLGTSKSSPPSTPLKKARRRRYAVCIDNLSGPNPFDSLPPPRKTKMSPPKSAEKAKQARHSSIVHGRLQTSPTRSAKKGKGKEVDTEMAAMKEAEAAKDVEVKTNVEKREEPPSWSTFHQKLLADSSFAPLCEAAETGDVASFVHDDRAGGADSHDDDGGSVPDIPDSNVSRPHDFPKYAVVLGMGPRLQEEYKAGTLPNILPPSRYNDVF